jgi:hypothetical protein
MFPCCNTCLDQQRYVLVLGLFEGESHSGFHESCGYGVVVARSLTIVGVLIAH